MWSWKSQGTPFPALIILEHSRTLINGLAAKVLALNISLNFDGLKALFDQKWIGDFDEMVERHKIRVLVPYSKTFFFLDGAKQVGVAYEGMKIFEKWLNQEIVCEQYLQVLYRLQDDYGTARGTK
jgi:hypothetical protein